MPQALLLVREATKDVQISKLALLFRVSFEIDS
jgi:hypothetical protein